MYIFKSNFNIEKALKSQREYIIKYISRVEREYNELSLASIPVLNKESFNEFYRSGNRLTYEKLYFKRRAMLRDFALMLFMGHDRAAEPLRKIIEAVCGEETWALPAHVPQKATDRKRIIDLFAAETAQSLTEIISLLGDRLGDDTLSLAVNEVRERVLLPYINRSAPYNWENMKNNWCAVCGGSVGMTAIYLTEDKERLKQILSSLENTFQSYMESFTEDGACLEGLYYWGYGMTYLTAFLDLYKQRFNEDFPIDYDKFKKMADFPCKCIMGNGVTTSFSDGNEHDRVYGGLVSYLKRNYGVKGVPSEYYASFLGDDCGRWCRAIRDICLHNTDTEDNLKSVNILPHAQWAVMRNDNLALSFKGGNNGEPHNHNDIGSFTLVKNGKVMLCDLGAGEYTKDYFSPNRYTIFTNRSMGHSVPIIDGEEQKAGKEYGAKAFICDDNAVGADISLSYGICKLTSLNRRLSLTESKITLTDIYNVTENTKITERFITRHKATVTGEKGVTITGGGERLLIAANMGRASIKTYTHYEHDGSKATVTAVDFTFDVNSEVKFSANFS